MEKARRIDPGNLAFTITTADYLKKAGKLEEAAALYRSAMEAEPSDPRALFGLAEILRRQGDMTGAIDALRKAYELTGEDDGVKALAAARTEKDYESAQVAVARARLARPGGAREGTVRLSARSGAAGGASGGAGEGVRTTSRRRSPSALAGLVLLKVDTAWDRIRDDARFAALVRRVGIP